MVKRVMVCVLVVLFALSMAGLASAADKVKGTITKVEDGGKSITVKGEDGAEITLKISGKRTEFKGIGGRDELKEGQNVSVTHDGTEASRVSVK